MTQFLFGQFENLKLIGLKVETLTIRYVLFSSVWEINDIGSQTLLQWIRNWFDECKVVVNDSISRWRLVMHGIPQLSVLVLMFFITQTNTTDNRSSTPSAGLQITPIWVVQLTQQKNGMTCRQIRTNLRSGPARTSKGSTSLSADAASGLRQSQRWIQTGRRRHWEPSCREGLGNCGWKVEHKTTS